ncbi:BglG family transcription antiterminator [Halalkalibacterium halodurans]|uniref:Transcriptional antiterminator n=3 Tax=Halalkalibacterium halodurans TaxID=86665 RepID=A0A0M0KFD9_ALKHA|nr:BglG family transcription antiterminator [Halalkalibacterium halodurans]TES47028.1 PRD domain-containing protein [Halalkalibacterium halodurans]TPE69547.1 transcription antiterminator [Halalkalibacterium halodurans]
MYISARERNILHQLLQHKDGLTIPKLAQLLDVSTRTIQRDLKGIEDILAEYGLKLNKSSAGLVISGGPSEQEKLLGFLQTLELNEFTPEERQMLLLAILLQHREPLKLFTLADELNVTVATISNDLTRAEAWLNGFRLELVRKRGYGVQIIGRESDIRRAISQLLAEHLTESKMYRMLSEPLDDWEQTDAISERLLHLINLELVRNIQEVLADFRKQMVEPMADRAYIGLIVHLTLAIERIRQGEKIEIDPSYLSKLKMDKEFELAADLARRLEQKLGMNIPEAEVGYMTMHIRGAKAHVETESLLEESNFQLGVRVKALIHEVEKSLHVQFQDPSLFQGLVAHLKPALYRIREKMKIYNPLLEKIKQDYEELFHVVQVKGNKVFEPITIPEEEAGFLVMHFGSALERLKRKRTLKVLVVCSSGIGSSKFLASRIEKEFPEITSIEQASFFELGEKNLHDYDLFLSTIPLHTDVKHFVVQPFLPPHEVKQIRAYLDEKLREPSAVTETGQASLQVAEGGSNVLAIERFAHFAKLNQDIYQVLSHFQLIQVERGISIEEEIERICRSLEQKGILTNGGGVAQALIERERAGGVAIPNTSLALFHTRSRDVTIPYFAMYEWGTPSLRKGMDNSLILVERVVLMLAPQDLEEVRLEYLSYLSTLIIESEETMRLFERASEQAVFARIYESSQAFVQEKINKDG